MLEVAGNDYERTQRAMTLAMAFWNLALLDLEKREELLADLVDTVAKEKGFDGVSRDGRGHGCTPSNDVSRAPPGAAMTIAEHAGGTVQKLVSVGERLPDKLRREISHATAIRV